MKSLISPLFKIRVFIFSCLLFWQLPLSAATFTVNTTSDLVDINLADGLCITVNDNCALRAAVQQANALEGADNITLPPGVYDLSLTGTHEDAAASGDLDITDTLTINGDGADQVFIDGQAADRVFQLLQGVHAEINGVTIRNGVADGLSLRGNSNGGNSNGGGFGGGIKSAGRLSLNDCNIDRNKAFNGGSGIHAAYRGFPIRGSLTVNRCNITNNGSGGGTGGFGGHIYAENIPMTIRDSVLNGSISSSTWGVLAGGGIFYSNSTYPFPPKALVLNTTISNNRAMSSGGGIHVFMGELEIINSTISGNTAYEMGGGLNVENSAIVKIVNSTLTDNSAPNGGGGGINDRNQMPVVTIIDSIISANIGGNCAVTAAGLNAVGSNLDSDGSCGFNLANLDPLLLPLTDNGGPGFTHALAEDSPALDAAASCLSTDQRSYLRPASGCDLGAIEMAALPPVVPVVTPVENNQVSASDIENAAPVAFNLPAAVIAGGVLHGIMNAYDPDGDRLSYEITEQALKGIAGLPVPGSNNDIPGGYTYTPLADASGFDFFKFRACDPYDACSDEMTIFITITDGEVADELSIDLTPDDGQVNGLVILSKTELAEIAPDNTYTYPLGGYFFSIEDVPMNDDGSPAQTVVTIQLAAGVDIPDNAEVRKLDNTGVWQTVSNVASVNTSSAIFDRVNKKIILSLVDNDIFDLNPELGIINDPIALGFAPNNAPDDADGDGDGFTDGNDAYPNDPNRAINCPAGQYGAFECVTAAPGYFVAESGQIVPTACPLGSFSAASGAVACTAAALGNYVDTTGSSSTQICPEGTTTASTGSINAQACLPINDNTAPDNSSNDAKASNTDSSDADTSNTVSVGGFGIWFAIVLFANVFVRLVLKNRRTIF